MDKHQTASPMLAKLLIAAKNLAAKLIISAIVPAFSQSYLPEKLPAVEYFFEE